MMILTTTANSATRKTNSLSVSCDIYSMSKALYSLLPGNSFSCGSMNPAKNFPISSKSSRPMTVDTSIIVSTISYSWKEEHTLIWTNNDKSSLVWTNAQEFIGVSVAFVVALVVVEDLVQVSDLVLAG